MIFNYADRNDFSVRVLAYERIAVVSHRPPLKVPEASTPPEFPAGHASWDGVLSEPPPVPRCVRENVQRRGDTCRSGKCDMHQ